jgi:hypothetical protein
MLSKFEWKLERAKIETCIFNSPAPMRKNVYFRDIIMLGQDNIPFLIQDLKKEPSWTVVFLLHQITGNWPLLAKDGKVQPFAEIYKLPQVAKAWIKLYDPSKTKKKPTTV